MIQFKPDTFSEKNVAKYAICIVLGCLLALGIYAIAHAEPINFSHAVLTDSNPEGNFNPNGHDRMLVPAVPNPKQAPTYLK